MKLLITGAAHSGTRYLNAVLQAAGLASGHELAISISGLNPKVKADIEVSWPAAPLIGELPADVVVWRAVRNPLSVANTLSAEGFFSSNSPHATLACEHVANMGQNFPELDYWLDWQSLTDCAERTWTVDLNFNVREFVTAAAKVVGASPKAIDLDAAGRVGPVGQTNYPLNYDATGYEHLEALLERAGQYGYALGIRKPRKKRAAKK